MPVKGPEGPRSARALAPLRRALRQTYVAGRLERREWVLSQVVACKNEELMAVAGNLRRVASHLEGRRTAFIAGDAFAGSNGAPNQTFDELCLQAGRARDAVAGELRELARAVENAANAFAEVDRSLVKALGGHL